MARKAETFSNSEKLLGLSGLFWKDFSLHTRGRPLALTGVNHFYELGVQGPALGFHDGTGVCQMCIWFQYDSRSPRFCTVLAFEAKSEGFSCVYTPASAEKSNGISLHPSR